MQVVVPDEFKHLYVKDSKRPILKVPHPDLRETAVEVKRVNSRIKNIIEQMIKIMRDARGIGLAAPQLGITERIVIVAPHGKAVPMVNPRIIEATGSEVAEEGCLSIPGLYGDVERATNIKVTAMDKKGRETTWELSGLAARVAQHEIDHLDGVLFIDKVDPTTLHWMEPPGRD